MSSLFTDIPEWVFYTVYLIFLIAVLLITVQMFRTDSILEKVLGLDLLTAIVMCFSAVFAIQSGNPVFLEISLSISIVAFLGTAAFARYLGRSEQR